MKKPVLICDIKRYEGLYAFTDDYRIWKYRSGNCKNGKIMKYINHKYTTNVNLSKNGKYKGFAVKMLIARYFVPNTNNYRYCIFKDGNRLNFNPLNLEWVRYNPNGREGSKNVKLKNEDVTQIRALWLKGHTYKKMASMFNVSMTAISLIINNVNWSR